MIVARRRVAQVTKTYSCDLLNKPINADDIHVTINDTLVVSKEAVRRLPESFRSREMLERMVFAVPSYDCGFRPEMLATGVWIFTGSTLYTSDKRGDVKFGVKLRNLDTVADALEYIEQRYAALDTFDFQVFENGVLVKSCVPDVRLREIPLTRES